MRIRHHIIGRDEIEDCIHLQATERSRTVPEKQTLERAEEDRREGKSGSTQAGEFVREEMHHIREGKHGARSTKQAIAIGLSKARRSGVKLGTPKRASASTKRHARSDARAAKRRARPSRRRSRATTKALKREGHKAASKKSLSRHAKTTPRRRRRASA
jgi:hypothetical protein